MKPFAAEYQESISSPSRGAYDDLVAGRRDSFQWPSSLRPSHQSSCCKARSSNDLKYVFADFRMQACCSSFASKLQIALGRKNAGFWLCRVQHPFERIDWGLQNLGLRESWLNYPYPFQRLVLRRFGVFVLQYCWYRVFMRGISRAICLPPLIRFNLSWIRWSCSASILAQSAMWKY